jgi:uncharacterized membrane protein
LRFDFRVCNTTQNLVGVAIGYRAKDGWITEGWWQVPATTCATLIVGPLTVALLLPLRRRRRPRWPLDG